jgi:hypothetical protein
VFNVDLVMKDIILPLGDRISIRPRADVTRHRSETVSQYELRLKNDLEHGNNLTSTFTKTVARSRKVQSLPFTASHTKNVLADLSTDPEPYSNYWYSTPGFAPSTTHDPIPCKKKTEDIYPEFPDSPDSPPLWLEGEERRLSQSTNPLYRKRAATTSNRKRPNSLDSAHVSNSHNPLLDTNYLDPPVTSSAKYSRVSTGSNSATRAIAQHYRERHQQQRRSSLTNAMSVLAPFLLSCVYWFRERNQFIACVIIQSVMRGHFIRRDVHHLILFLRFRKCLRMLARLCIRNWARKRADSVHSMRASRRLAKLRNLPALVAVNMEEFRAVPHGVW